MATDEELIERAVAAAGLGFRYKQAHREYHNLVHVENVLQKVQLLEPPESAELALCLAAWFHDAVYAPGRADNEARSAFLARDTLELVGASPELGDEVSRLVLLTGTHGPTSDVAGAILCDADLSILASEPAAYARYTREIRQEYSLVPDHRFRHGRLAVLRRLLDRPSMFSTSYGADQWEKPARVNVENEIKGLEEGGP